MRIEPQRQLVVLRAQDMPGGVTLWAKHSPTKTVVYVDADEMTAHQAQMLEQALRSGLTIDDLIDGAEE